MPSLVRGSDVDGRQEAGRQAPPARPAEAGNHRRRWGGRPQDRPLRRRRVRAQPRRGGGGDPLSGRVRGRAPDGLDRRLGRGAHPGRAGPEVTDLEQARALARGALASLERSRQRIDGLNVYPVPDGDTGTNLLLTVRAVVEALETTNADERATLVREVTRAALMASRGNSGVILSQILRGAAEALGEADEVDAATIARALRAASDAAYRAVGRPVEGTMLTVVRE